MAVSRPLLRYLEPDLSYILFFLLAFLQGFVCGLRFSDLGVFVHLTYHVKPSPTGSLAYSGVDGQPAGGRRSLRSRTSCVLQQPEGLDPVTRNVQPCGPTCLRPSTQSSRRHGICLSRTSMLGSRIVTFLGIVCLVCHQEDYARSQYPRH